MFIITIVKIENQLVERLEWIVFTPEIPAPEI
jgi:hypothetical protein